CFVFFFSSRRRHTSSKRDWSSDVCSSDLACSLDAPSCRADRWTGGSVERACGVLSWAPGRWGGRDAAVQRCGRRRRIDAANGARSEERRVGKGWGERRAARQGERRSEEKE